jgi:hypothetical protein
MLDDEIMTLHRQGFATGAIAIRLSVESNHVRNVVRTHLKAVAETSKPPYSKDDARKKAEAKLAKAQRDFEEAKAALAETD